MRVIVTGSRSWREPDRVFMALETLTLAGDLTVVHGACKQGADKFARDWCERAQFRSDVRVTEERHPADWETWGKRAGPVRNEEMVRLGADLILAFFDWCSIPNCPGNEGYLGHDAHPTHGAAHCEFEAEIAGIHPIVFWSQK